MHSHASAQKGCDLGHMKNKIKLVCPFYFFIRHLWLTCSNQTWTHKCFPMIKKQTKHQASNIKQLFYEHIQNKSAGYHNACATDASIRHSFIDKKGAARIYVCGPIFWVCFFVHLLNGTDLLVLSGFICTFIFGYILFCSPPPPSPL